MGHWIATACLVALLTACGGEGKAPGVDATADARGMQDLLAEASAPDQPCVPNCSGKVCGPDGCGGMCGACDPGVSCLPDGTCEPCQPDCEGKECGPDGCAGECDDCPPALECSPEGLCEPVVDPCQGRQCGNWEGKWCGDCPCDDCAEDEVECDATTGQCFEQSGPCDCTCISPCQEECPEGDEDCWKECINSASIDDQMAYNNLYACWEEVDLWGCWDLCPEDTEYADCPEEFHDCMDEKEALCEDEYYACYIPGDLACEELFDCFDTCQDDDSPCVQDCYQSGTIEAQKTASAMWHCYDEAGAYDCWDLCLDDPEPPIDCWQAEQECLEEALSQCQDETDACFPPGTLNCFDMSLCAYTCPEGDGDCIQDCFDEGSDEASELWNAIYYCMVDNGLEDCADNDEECFELVFGACKEEQYACRSGEATCKEIRDCLDTCGPVDEWCTLECIWNGTGAAQDAYQAVVDCVQAECGDDPAADCQSEAFAGACKDGLDACVDP